MQRVINKLPVTFSALVHILLVWVVLYNPSKYVVDLSQPLEIVDVFFAGHDDGDALQYSNTEGEDSVRSKNNRNVGGLTAAQEELRYQQLISMKIGENLKKVIEDIGFSFDVKLALKIDLDGNIVEYRVVTEGRDVRSVDLIDKIVSASNPLPKPPKHLSKALEHTFVIPIKYKR